MKQMVPKQAEHHLGWRCYISVLRWNKLHVQRNRSHMCTPKLFLYLQILCQQTPKGTEEIPKMGNISHELQGNKWTLTFIELSKKLAETTLKVRCFAIYGKFSAHSSSCGIAQLHVCTLQEHWCPNPSKELQFACCLVQWIKTDL